MTTKKTTDDLFNEDNEAKTGWFKFENVGDTVKGYLQSSSVKPARDMFPEQEVWELRQEDGEIVNVASSKTFVRNAMRRAKIGQMVGFKYDSDYQTDANKAKGMAPAKTIKVFLGAMDPAFDEILGAMEEQKATDNLGEVDFS